jgi:hypothetical protein
MSNRQGSGSCVRLRGYSLVIVTLFILGSGIALLHPAGVRSAITQGMSEKAMEMSNRLARLSQVTGGHFYSTSTSEGAVKIAAQLMENLHRQYELAYIPANDKPDNVLRKISILVTPKDGRQIKATTRQNCYGPGYKIIR